MEKKAVSEIIYDYVLFFHDFPPRHTTVSYSNKDYLKLVLQAIENNKPLTSDDIDKAFPDADINLTKK